VFSFGVNDTTLENGKTRVELSNLQKIVEILSAAAAVVSGLNRTTADCDSGQNQNRPFVKRRLMCRELDVPYLDIFTLCRVSYLMSEAAANDGSHPDSAGYVELALGTKLVCLSWSIVLSGAVQSVMFYKEADPCTWMKTAWIRN